MSREINLRGAARRDSYYLPATRARYVRFRDRKPGKRGNRFAPQGVKVKNGIRAGRETVLLAAAQGTRWIKTGAIS